MTDAALRRVVALIAASGSMIAGWAAVRAAPLAAGIAALAVMLAMPESLLLASAVVLGHGLTIPALQVGLVGPLMATDILLIAWLVRVSVRRDGIKAPLGQTPLLLGGFLGWSLLATLYVGVSVTPLLRISLYSAVFVLLARSGAPDRRKVYVVVLGYALVNLVGGVLQGQPRLLGLDVGDPAQMGGLLLAALCPILAGDLRFRGRWYVGLILAYGIWLTQTRAVWFAAIVVVVVWSQRKLSPIKLLVVITALAVVGFQIVSPISEALGLNTTSGDLRYRSIASGIRSGIENPIFGTGWANASLIGPYGIALPSSEGQALPYNLFVNVFMSVGVPGLLLFVLFLSALLKRLTERRDACLLFTVAVLAMSLTEMTIYAGSTLTLLLFIYAGIGFNDRPERPGNSARDEQLDGTDESFARLRRPQGQAQTPLSGTPYRDS